MEKKSTRKLNRTRLTHLTWLGALVISALLFARCYEWTFLVHPTEATTNSSFTVEIALKQDGVGDFAHNLWNKGCFGVLLPEGWTVDDSIEYVVRGTLQNEPVGPYTYAGTINYDSVFAQMYEDSIGSDVGYYWWGGLSDSTHVDNLDSIYIVVNINTDDQVGSFELQYAMGTLDWEVRYPYVNDNDEAAGISPKMPITVTATNIKRYMKREISIYPNPASDVLHVNVGGIQEGEIQLLDMTGRLFLDHELNSKVSTFDVSDYAAGSYILRVSTDEGAFSKKLLIK